MSELRTNRIVPRDGLSGGASGGITQIKWMQLTGSSHVKSRCTLTLTEYSA